MCRCTESRDEREMVDTGADRRRRTASWNVAYRRRRLISKAYLITSPRRTRVCASTMSTIARTRNERECAHDGRRISRRRLRRAISLSLLEIR